MKATKKITIGSVTIGGGMPVAVQSMTTTDTGNARSTIRQIRRLQDCGCEIVRVAVPDMAAVKALRAIRKAIRIPLVADIHFDYRLALASIAQGVDKIRINPGNIQSKPRLKAIVAAAREAGIPIRIGVNAGSVKVKGAGQGTARDMVNAAVRYVRMFEGWDFRRIVVSAKAADVPATVNAYRLLSRKIRYPLHVGITESGPPGIGTVKSALGIGLLVSEGIGDTIRVSLSAPPEIEVRTAYQILTAARVRQRGIELISCPTCSRCRIDLISLVKQFEKQLDSSGLYANTHKHIQVAVMGCEVNGPGEARHAHIGIAGGKNTGLLFKKGKPVRKVAPKQWIDTLIKEIKRFR